MAKGIFRGLALGVATSLLVACGGGGGGGGSDGGGNSPLVPNPAETMKLTFSADRTSLPLNIAGDAAAIGSPYTSTINLRSNYVAGGGTEGGNCWSAEFNIIGGAASGFLVPPLLAGATSGSTTFFTSSSSGNWNVLLTSTANAGTVTIEVAVPNPDTATVTCNDDKIEIGARFAGTPISYIREQFQVAVGQATGKASQIRINKDAQNFLETQNSGGTTQLIVQAQVLDEAGQVVPDPASGTRNLYASIVETPEAADDDALLRASGASGKWVLARSTNGQAQFTLVSGTAPGGLLVEILTDRFDNNVDNGITEPVRNYYSVSVGASVGQEALAVSTATDLPSAEEEKSYATILAATGGVPPYKWERVAGSSLPSGLSLSTDGVITGTPFVDGLFRFALRVTDSATSPQSVMKEFSIAIAAAPEEEPVIPLLAVETKKDGLPTGTINQPYVALLTASGGTVPYTWSAASLPTGLSVSAEGVVSGTPTVGGTFDVALTVKDADSRVANRIVTIKIQGGGSGTDETPPKVSFTIPAHGARDVSPNAVITVVFNEAMDPDSIVPASFAVYRLKNTATLDSTESSDIDTTLPSAVEVIANSDRRFTFSPDDPEATNANFFIQGRIYRVVMSTSPRDVAGNQICKADDPDCLASATPVVGSDPSLTFQFKVGDQLP
ncbi:Ig-like domain-containing protein [Aromatoleum aromaticum]|uniref:Ig-like domain-containing protein n=1 Tax=Aromatoleum aromaticum TaxID=551760 RepID=UPI001459A7DB|nr:Ig-like domain-containing protein [Aromatoleum aromaticum]NMG56547.1 hypothetical protein [Aromatoleum aromaticum]